MRAEMKPILFWLGAGKASSIKLNPSDYEKVFLVEAQSVLCDKLKEKYQSYEQVEVINACLAPDGSESAKQFNVFNVNEFSSLKAPTGLKALFPGLQVTKTLELDVCGLNTIFESVEPEADYELIVDLPDIAGQIIDDLSSRELIQCFKKIMITCGTTSLYEGAHNYAQIMCALEKQYFEESSVDDSDPDILVVSAIFDRKTKLLATLEMQAERLKQRLDEERHINQVIADERDNLKSKSETLKEENERLTTQCESLTQQHSELSQQVSAKENELALTAQTIEAITAEVDALTLELSNKAELNQQLNVEVAELKSNLDELQSTTNAFRDSCQELSEEVEAKTQHIRANERRIQTLEESVEQHVLDKAKLEELISAKQREIEEHIEQLQQANEANKCNDEARFKLEESLAQIKAESETSAQQWAQTLQETQESLKSAQEELERLRQDKQADEALCRQLEENIAQFKQEKQDAEERLQTHKEKYKALEQYNEALKRKADESNKLSMQHSATLELTTKQNMKLHIDLDNLRTKYAEKVESETSLKELITELHEKLQQAANFYRKLESSNPELLGGKSE